MLFWKGNFFKSSIIGKERNELKITWFPATQDKELTDDSFNGFQDDLDECDGLNVPDNIVGNSPFQKSSVRNDSNVCGKISEEIFNLGKDKSGKLLKSGFSFDSSSFCRLPVFLIKIENSLKHSKCNKRITSSPAAAKPVLQKNGNTLLLVGLIDNTIIRSCKKKPAAFSLVPLRIFKIPDLCDSDNVLCYDVNHIRFISDFGFVYFHKEQNKLSFTLYFGKYQRDSQTVIQNFVCDKTETTESITINAQSGLRIMDTTNCFLKKMFLVLIQWTDSESQDNKCAAFLFYNLYGTRYDVKRIETEFLFPAAFEQIAKSIAFSSMDMVRNPPNVKSTCLVMLTTTNYVIKFAQGQMIQCVKMNDVGFLDRNVTQQLEIKTLDFTCDSEERTALHSNKMCCLVDWRNRKMCVLQKDGVQSIAKLDNPKDGNTRLLLSMALQSPQHDGKEEVDRCAVSVSVVDVSLIGSGEPSKEEEEQSIECGHDDFSLLSRHSPDRKEDKEDCGKESKWSEASRNVLKGLMFQEKKCQMELSDLRRSLKCKEVFIEQTCQHFSQLKNSAGTNSRVRHFDQPSLVPLIDNASVVGEHNDWSLLPCPVQVGKLWHRTVGQCLVCGLHLSPLSQSGQLCDVFLELVPINPCRTVVESKSVILNYLPPTNSFLSSSSVKSSTVNTPSLTSTEPSSSPPPKKACFPPTNRHPIPEPGRNFNSTQSTANFNSNIVAFVNTQDFWGCEDISIQVFLTYSTVVISKSKKEGNMETTKQAHKTNCGVVSISQAEKLGEVWSVESRMKNCQHNNKDLLTAEDVLALDCVQSHLDLQVSSVLTPVSSLLKKVKGHPSMAYSSMADQYIYTADHRLRMCRMKWLKHLDNFNAVIRLFSRSQEDLLLFIEFLSSISPTDVTFHLDNNSSSVEKSNTDSSSSIKWVIKSLSEDISRRISHLSHDLMEKARVPQETKTNASTSIDDIMEVDILEEDIPSSPTFPSSIQKIELKQTTDLNFKSKNCETASKKKSVFTAQDSAVLSLSSKPEVETIPVTTKTKSEDAVIKPSTSRRVVDLDQFDFGDDFLNTVAKDSSRSRKGAAITTTTGGGKKGGKGKLTMKKKS